MTRLLPHPMASAMVLLMWLLLAQSPSPGQIVLGVVIAWLGGLALGALGPERIGLVSVRPALRLAVSVVVDVIRSNLAVAKLVLFPRERISEFVSLPLELRNPNGLAMLACIITATPGTIWVRYDRSSGVVLIHILDLIDEEEWVRLIKRRYEAPLLEIFGR